MPYHFQYVPLSGALSGRALEEQTERAFNELGADMDAFQKSADQALDVAANARSTANEALGTANQAISETQAVIGLAREAKDESNTALAAAEAAQDTANQAIDTALDASCHADDATAAAQAAQANARAALDVAQNSLAVADNAEEMARNALARQGDDFWVNAASVDANTSIASQRIYATGEILNSPVAAPAYFQVMASSDESSATQAVWRDANPAPYLRTGKITWSAIAGSSDFEFTTVIDYSEAPGPTGTLTISNDAAVMSGVFSPGAFTQSAASMFTLEGTAGFAVGANFSGSVMWGEIEIARVVEGEAVLLNSLMSSDNVRVTVISALYDEDTLSMRIFAAWVNRSNSIAWGDWAQLGNGNTPAVMCLVHREAALSFPQNAFTVVPMDTLHTDRYGMLQSDGTIQVPEAGNYLIVANTVVTDTSTQRNSIILRIRIGNANNYQACGLGMSILNGVPSSAYQRLSCSTIIPVQPINTNRLSMVIETSAGTTGASLPQHSATTFSVVKISDI